jgi:hypothetical protein
MPQRIENSNVKLLIHGDGLVDDYVIKDQCGNAIANTSVTLSATQKKFGKYSMYFNGSALLSVADSPDWDFGAADFTVDWWEYCSDLTSERGFVFVRDAATTYTPFNFGYKSGSGNPARIYITSNGSSWDIASGKSLGTPTVNTLYHYAVVRNGNNFYAFRDGVQTDTWSSSGTILASSAPLTIGRYNAGGYFTGYLSELRITKKAMWIGGTNGNTYFTPPETPARGRKGWY